MDTKPSRGMTRALVITAEWSSALRIAGYSEECIRRILVGAWDDTLPPPKPYPQPREERDECSHLD